MKRKLILALIATLTLTVGSFGTAFAMNSTPTIELQTNENLKQAEEPEHVHTWGEPTWHKISDAVYEPVKVIDQEEKWDWVTNIITPAWDEDITEVQTICCSCEEKGIHTQFVNSQVVGTGESLSDHVKAHMLNGESGAYGSREVVVDTIHHEAVTEDVWTKVQDEISHYEDKLITPEHGYWEHTCSVCGEIQNKDTGEVIKPGTLPEEPTEPEEPENPDSGDVTDPTDPETPETDDPTTEEPENPNTGDNTGDQTETPNEDTQNSTDKTETDNNKQEQQDNDKTTTTDTTDKSENTDTATTVSNENKAPQTGDTASLIYLATLAGSAVTGGTAFGLRRKFKKQYRAIVLIHKEVRITEPLFSMFSIAPVSF